MNKNISPAARRLFYAGQKTIIERQIVELNTELARVTLALDQAHQKPNSQAAHQAP